MPGKWPWSLGPRAGPSQKEIYVQQAGERERQYEWHCWAVDGCGGPTKAWGRVVTAVFTTEQEWSSRKRSDTLGWGAAVSCCSGVSLTTEGGIESLKVQA